MQAAIQRPSPTSDRRSPSRVRPIRFCAAIASSAGVDGIGAFGSPGRSKAGPMNCTAKARASVSVMVSCTRSNFAHASSRVSPTTQHRPGMIFNASGGRPNFAIRAFIGP